MPTWKEQMHKPHFGSLLWSVECMLLLLFFFWYNFLWLDIEFANHSRPILMRLVIHYRSNRLETYFPPTNEAMMNDCIFCLTINLVTTANQSKYRKLSRGVEPYPPLCKPKVDVREATSVWMASRPLFGFCLGFQSKLSPCTFTLQWFSEG